MYVRTLQIVREKLYTFSWTDSHQILTACQLGRGQHLCQVVANESRVWVQCMKKSEFDHFGATFGGTPTPGPIVTTF